MVENGKQGSGLSYRTLGARAAKGRGRAAGAALAGRTAGAESAQQACTPLPAHANTHPLTRAGLVVLGVAVVGGVQDVVRVLRRKGAGGGGGVCVMGARG